jgi:uncharacterized membrane protein
MGLMRKSVQRTWFAGLFLVAPMLFTVWVVYSVVGYINDMLGPWVLRVIQWMQWGSWLESAWVNYVSPFVSVALAASLIYLVGLFGGNVLGRQAFKLLERFIKQIPFAGGIYSATKQLADTLANSKGGPSSRGVALLEYPRPGAWTLVLVTGPTSGEVAHVLSSSKMISVFVPTTPNPTSGFLLFVPETALKPVHMSVDDALKMVMSGGLLVPAFKGE